MPSKLSPRTAAEEQDEGLKLPDRDEELSGRENIHEALIDLYRDIERGYENQNERANDQMDY